MQRKTVTVLFCDVTGSTALGESIDPEALRALLARYFERMKGIVESHGGTVEKFIGDAVMAVFGVPQVHEDDALRACRAAVNMREALPQVGVEGRIGMNTGEVVTGTDERLVTGDAVNVAARLEQAAAPGEILVGADTLALVRDAVEADPVEPLELKGKADPVPAFRLVGVHETTGRRAHGGAFVGRHGELETLVQAWTRARDEKSCQLVTVVGDPGVGKSRLAAEFLAGADARVVHGRCLSYGEGITYWPVVEVLRQLDALPSEVAAAAALRSLLGETRDATSADEIAWAFRKLLEEQSPLICVFDDIQWGEETFLELVEHVALLSMGAPILLLCLGRSELAERRPQWPVLLRLDPLPQADVEALIPETFSTELREGIERAAGGNPLFVTEMVAMAREADRDVAVPPNLKALLAARLDQLDEPERSVLERGAVEGELFHRTAVQALSSDAQVTPRLAALVRKELLRPDKPRLAGDDAFRFRHLLIRDAAYDALPKATRAELHERFASWLDERAADLVERDEILGHHLEQAARYKAELGHPDSALAERAGELLAAAGRRALWRGDARAAASLLERALELTRPVRFDAYLEIDRAQSYFKHDPERAAALADSVAERAQDAGDEAGAAVARVVAAHNRMEWVADPPIDELTAMIARALPLLEATDDHAGLVHVWFAQGFGVANTRGQFDEWATAAQKAIHHARLAGQQRTDLLNIEGALIFGPRPADEGVRILDGLVADAHHPQLVMARAVLLAMLGQFDESWPAARVARERLLELGDNGGDLAFATIASYAGDHRLSAEWLRRFCDSLEQHGQRGILSTFAPALGRELCELGRFDEAEQLANLGRELGAAEDFSSQALWRQVQARVHSHRAEQPEGERLAREAVAITERMDGLNFQGDAHCDLAEVLAAAGRTDEAAAALEQALERYERKKNLAMVAQVKPKLEELRARVS